MFSSLLGTADELGLTMDESKELASFQRSLVILGPAGGAVLLCPGNQVGVPTEQRCAYAAKCPLLRAGKAPADKLCPIERSITEERFSSWSRTIGQDPEYLTEDARSTVATLAVRSRRFLPPSVPTCSMAVPGSAWARVGAFS